MTVGLPQDAAGRFADAAFSGLAGMAAASDVVALGPGSDAARTWMSMSPVDPRTRPADGLDADGLNAMVGQRDAWRMASRRRSSRRIRANSAGSWKNRPPKYKRSACGGDRNAQATGVVVVLKGQGTIVTDGERVFVNATGNPGMATAGSGDVLTGLSRRFWPKGFAAFEAAQLAAHLHGRAGDLARDTIGEVSLIATDLLDFLPKAIRETHSTSA